MKDWEKEFDKKFVQFNEFGTPIGGLEQAPYDRIKQFLTQKLKEQAEEIKQLLDDEGYVGKDDIIWLELPIISEMSKSII